MTQYCRQLINCLNLPIELTPMVKTIITRAFNCWKKTQRMLGCQSLKYLHLTKKHTYTEMHQQIPIVCRKY